MEITNNSQNKNKPTNIIKRATGLASRIQHRFDRMVYGNGYKSLQSKMDQLENSGSLSNNKKDAIRERLDDDTVFGAHFRLMSSPSHYTYSGDDAIEQMFDDRILIEEFIEKGLLPAEASSFYAHISPKKLEMFRNSKLSREELISKIANKENSTTVELLLLFALADARELQNFDESSVDEYTAEEIQKIKVRATKRNRTGAESERDRAEIEDIVELGKCLKLLIRNAKTYYKESILGGLTPNDAPQKA